MAVFPSGCGGVHGRSCHGSSPSLASQSWVPALTGHTQAAHINTGSCSAV